jgi:hypothetical protein
MRSIRALSITLFVLFTLAACVPPPAVAPRGDRHPDLIIVREFSFSPGIVRIDPSLGFSLYRGEPGAPPTERAMTIGRAAAFNLADAVATRLTALGYDVVRSNTATAEPGGRALIVTGAFGWINAGYRHEGASLSVVAEVDDQVGAAAPRQLSAFNLDSRTVVEGSSSGDVDAAAERVGAALARYAERLARLNRWPAAPR